MNREQFDVWVTAHYTELLAVARRHTRNPDDAEQDAQEVVRRMLSCNVGSPATVVEDTPRSEFPDQPWTWATFMLRGVRDDRRGRDKTRHDARADAEQIFSDQRVSLDADTFQPVGNVGGIGRWRYQQIRDESLFQKAWLEDERDAFRRAMRRRHHFGEPGVSYVQFGQEVSA